MSPVPALDHASDLHHGPDETSAAPPAAPLSAEREADAVRPAAVIGVLRRAQRLAFLFVVASTVLDLLLSGAFDRSPSFHVPFAGLVLTFACGLTAHLLTPRAQQTTTAH